MFLALKLKETAEFKITLKSSKVKSLLFQIQI